MKCHTASQDIHIITVSVKIKKSTFFFFFKNGPHVAQVGLSSYQQRIDSLHSIAVELNYTITTGKQCFKSTKHKVKQILVSNRITYQNLSVSISLGKTLKALKNLYYPVCQLMTKRSSLCSVYSNHTDCYAAHLLLSFPQCFTTRLRHPSSWSLSRLFFLLLLQCQFLTNITNTSWSHS